MPAADRRTERTRAALTGAFIGLLLEEGFNSVTVERVAARANVGRSTFYMHFTGKDDVLRACMTAPSTTLAVLVGNQLPAEALIRQLDHFHQQRHRNHVFFAGPVRTLWVARLAELIEPRLARLAQHARARPVLPPTLAALQVAEGQIALIANWLNGRGPAKIEAVADALVATTRATVAALLRLSPDAPLMIPGEKLRIIESGKPP